MSKESKEIKLEVLVEKKNNLEDFESLSANTEDSLLNSSRSGSESSTISTTRKSRICCSKPCRKNCSTCCGFTTGLILTTIGILLLIWSPFYILMETRLDMTPGLPAFEWWKTPPDAVFVRAFIFNITNSERFLDGRDLKLRVEEIGPIVYIEKLRHVNVTHNENDTLSYTGVRTADYVPELNTIDLNSTIIVPNYALLAMASHLYDASIIVKFGFNLLLRGVKSPVFINTTIYNFLWNLTDPILGVAKQISPHMVPSENYAMLDTVYRDFSDRATVYIGQKNGHEKFFLIDKFDGSEYLKGHGPSCPEKVVNSTEGALYPQYLTKNTTLRYWRKTLCRIIPLVFEREQFMEDYNVLAYKFTKSKAAYDRNPDLSKDCNKGEPILPSGLSDVSVCFNGISMAASYPHYLYASEDLQHVVDGLSPNKTIHESYTFVEPLTGIPISSVARSQSNMIVKDTMSFSTDLQKFNNLVIPMFWLEVEQMGLPYYVKNMMNFTVNLCPKYQYYVVATILIIGLCFLTTSCRTIYKNITSKRTNYSKNTKLQFEKQNFLKQ